MDRMERPTRGYHLAVDRSQEETEDGLRSELGQTLALFGMILAVVLIAVLVGFGL
jgi:hypothetical protein